VERRRADLVLVERGLFESRAKARAAIEAGAVTADGRPVSAASDLIAADVALEARPAHPWVGRGGLKLAHALDIWPIEVAGKTVLDLGASTGGFTEVCLAAGAARVYAVDVGQGQLHRRLADDPRVVERSRTDARQLDARLVPEAPQLIVCDISFISLTKALPAALALAGPAAALVALVKPQFELEPAAIGKGGMVKRPEDRRRALEQVMAFLATEGWSPRAEAESPIKGGAGAREYLLWAAKL
jgi:23S rRNA (cytidine1920-2'-O)/16S rRNA (cytidine1409-2'-O)-methyltransferase